MAFLIRNVTGSAIPLNDIGLTVPALSLFDLTSEQPNDIAMSDDLKAAVAAGNIVVLDPLTTGGSPVNGGSPEVYLTAAQGEFVVGVHNDPHFRINGGTLNQLDDVDTTGAQAGDIFQLVGSPHIFTPVSPAAIASGNIRLGDLNDINSPSPSGSPSVPGWSNGTLYALLGNGSNEADVVPLFGGSPQTNPELCEAVEDIVGEMVGTRSSHTDISVSYVDGAGQCDGQLNFSVDDVFLRNTGDTLDSGTLTIASGASIAIATGADLTIADAPTNATDAVNKAYVDGLASGLDPKESVRAATTGDVGGSFAVGGGSPNGAGTTITGASAFFDGFQIDTIGDRVLVKDQTDPTQNGIYEVTAVGVGSPLTVDLVRATDQDGTPANEVSGGNFTFVENGDTLASTGWVLSGDGVLDVNADNIVWVQFSEAGQVTDGIGISKSGIVLDLNVNDLTTATITDASELAFHLPGGSPVTASGSTTRKTTVADFRNDLGIPSFTGVGPGIVVVGGSPADPFAVSIAVNGAGALDGLSITNPTGVGGNPTIGLDINGLPVRSDAVDVTDRVPVYNITTGANEYYTVGELAGAVATTNSFSTWAGAGNTTGDANIVADSSSDTATLSGGDGINIDFTAATDTVVFSLTRNGLADTAVEGTDTFPFFDGSNANAPEYRSFNDLVTDLDLTVGGLTAADVTGSQGTQVVLVGSPQTPDVQLDIGGLTTQTITGTDQLVFFGGSPQQHYNITAANFISDLGLNVADISASDGIEINLVGSPQVQDISLDFFSLPDTPATLTDVIAFGDVSGSPQVHASRTLGDLFNDLNVVNNISGNGILVQTGGSPQFASRAITAAGVGLLDGLSVTNGDGTAGDPQVGLDIDGTPAANEELAASDELIIKNASAGTGSPTPGENQKITGQELADGVLSISGLGGLSVTTIGGQEVLTLVDTTRSNKVLSVETSAITWAENNITNNDWVRIGNSTDASSGYVVPLDATIVKVVAHTSDDNGNSKDIDLYIDGSNNGAIVSFTAVSGENEFTDNTLNIDVDAGEKIRLRGDAAGGLIDDTVITIWLKWRG